MQEPHLFDVGLHIRTSGDPEQLAALLRNQVKELDPHLPLYNVKSLAAQIDQSLLSERLVTWLCSAFGLLATLLVALGLYGVLTFSVARRTREIGIRVALGAQRRDVLRLIITHGVILVGAGIVIGIGASFALSRVMTTLLFGISPTNALTFAVAALMLMAIALIACYVPARRATKVDPLVALRYE
jgi:ABC-type lipoprotein release transport system permease subunit